MKAGLAASGAGAIHPALSFPPIRVRPLVLARPLKEGLW